MLPQDWDVTIPHVFDAILNSALDNPDDRLFRDLRLVSRSTRDFIDTRIVKHGTSWSRFLESAGTHTLCATQRKLDFESLFLWPRL